MGVAKTFVVLSIIFLFAVFVLQNSAVVEIKLLFWKLTMSRVLLLIGSLAAGFLVGLILGWEIFGKKKKTEITKNTEGF
ncbi:MAG TPA: LapA family protein [Thermodesulfobacteriota bacterium]|nr:LapA family protein [Thermodesulfobacteriota bacterium]